MVLVYIRETSCGEFQNELFFLSGKNIFKGLGLQVITFKNVLVTDKVRSVKMTLRAWKDCCRGLWTALVRFLSGRHAYVLVWSRVIHTVCRRERAITNVYNKVGRSVKADDVAWFYRLTLGSFRSVREYA